MFAVDSRDSIYCATNPDEPDRADWEIMEDVKACQLAVSSDGNVAWRLDRLGGEWSRNRWQRVRCTVCCIVR